MPVFLARRVTHVEHVLARVRPRVAADAPLPFGGQRARLVDVVARRHPDVQNTFAGREPSQMLAVWRDAGGGPLGVAEEQLARNQRGLRQDARSGLRCRVGGGRRTRQESHTREQRARGGASGSGHRSRGYTARVRSRRVVGGLVAALALAGCAEPGPSVTLRGQRFRVEVADTPAKQRVGLMFRERLPADAGMLFVFPRSRPREFWMKNTRIPLDILYFDAELKLIRVHHAARPCTAEPCPRYPSGGDARYTLELAGGTAKRLGAQVGDSLGLALD